MVVHCRPGTGNKKARTMAGLYRWRFAVFPFGFRMGKLAFNH